MCFFPPWPEEVSSHQCTYQYSAKNLRGVLYRLLESCLCTLLFSIHSSLWPSATLASSDSLRALCFQLRKSSGLCPGVYSLRCVLETLQTVAGVSEGSLFFSISWASLYSITRHANVLKIILCIYQFINCPKHFGKFIICFLSWPRDVSTVLLKLFSLVFSLDWVT